MTIKNAKIISWVLLILLCSFRITRLVYAVDTVLEVGIPGVPGAEPGAPVSGIVQYISFLYTFVLGFVGIAGFASIVFWGAVWTASGVVDQKSRALEGIKNALYGIGIAFTAFIILNTINPDLTVIKLPMISDINIQSAIPEIDDMLVDIGTATYISELFGDDSDMAIKIAGCESSFNSTLVSKTNDVGIFQINLTEHGSKIPGDTRDEKIAWLQNPRNNIRYAEQLYRQNGWRDWFMSYTCHSPEGSPLYSYFKKAKDDYCAKNPKPCGEKEKARTLSPELTTLFNIPKPPPVSQPKECGWWQVFGC